MSNYITAYGNLTRDPKVRFTPDATAIVTGTIATNRREKRGSEWASVATFFNFKIWGKRGEAFAKFHKKGSRAFLHGTITTESWTDKKSGEEESKQLLLVSEWEFCSESPDEGRADPTVEDVPEGGPFPWEKK